MASNAPFKLPEVSDDDVRWASDLLGLPRSAFLGEDGCDPRKIVIQSGSNLDVGACPGSGKTTVLVAKLAILALRWRLTTRGICVLSHTNVARGEIEERLGNTSEGQRLLSYPHFIGTIHRFVNEFLAIPWLRSLGYPVKMVETDVCEARRWKKILANGPARSYLEKKSVERENIRIMDVAFNVGKKNGTFPCKPSTDTYKAVQQACREVAVEGYHCYDDMFVWARDLLLRYPVVRSSVRYRFPILFLDEAQDNSEEQSSLLYELFVRDQPAVIRQRFGDGNQAIYGFIQQEGAISYKFPDKSIEIQLPNSFRFGQTIANLADPLGVVPYSMCGRGPRKEALAPAISERKHTIFAFDHGSTEKVLDSYGALLLESFSDHELRVGTFTAVGMVHKVRDGGPTTAQKPHRVGDYWASYDPEIARLEPCPKTFVQYVQLGVAASDRSSEVHHAVERIAEAILRLATMAAQSTEYAGRRYKHRFVLELLEHAPDKKTLYLDLLVGLTTRKVDFTEHLWETQWKGAIRGIAEGICGVSLAGSEVDEFLGWQQAAQNIVGETKERRHLGNIYSYRRDNREVRIKVGSIHSVKGQTHTATLVLETAWHGRNLEQIITWLSGESKGYLKKDGVRNETRLKTHYVAMTRPSHLLCLALHRQSMHKSDGTTNQALIDELKARGWDVVNV